jgi:hypothetical protein
MPAKSRVQRYESRFFARGRHSIFSNPVVDWQGHWIDSVTNTRSAGAGGWVNWKQRIREHKTATSSLNGVRWTVERSPTRGHLVQRLRIGGSDPNYYPDTVRYYGYPWPTRVSASASGLVIQDGVADREANKKFFKKFAQMTKSMEGFVLMGELRETLRMLRNPAKSLFESAKNDYLGALKKRKHRDPKNWARGLSGAWLEWVFGVMPLVSDINGVVDSLDRFNSDPIVSRVITAVGRQRQTLSPSSYHVWIPDEHELVFSGKTEQYLKQKVKLRGLYLRERSEIKNLTTTQKLAQTFGLNAREFVPAMWELMPWSFLIDYFTNIGDILEQTFTNLESLAWCNRTQVDEGVYVTNSNLDIPRTKTLIASPNFSFLESASPGADARCLITRTGFDRNPGGPQVSPFELEIPGSPQKWLNIAALGVQANSIHPQRFNFRR